MKMNENEVNTDVYISLMKNVMREFVLKTFGSCHTIYFVSPLNQ